MRVIDKDIPNLVQQLNIFMDTNGVLMVGKKCKKYFQSVKGACPILLPKASDLTKLIVRSYHEKFSHGRIYSILAEIRMSFYIFQLWKG